MIESYIFVFSLILLIVGIAISIVIYIKKKMEITNLISIILSALAIFMSFNIPFLKELLPNDIKFTNNNTILINDFFDSTHNKLKKIGIILPLTIINNGYSSVIIEDIDLKLKNIDQLNYIEFESFYEFDTKGLMSDSNMFPIYNKVLKTFSPVLIKDKTAIDKNIYFKITEDDYNSNNYEIEMGEYEIELNVKLNNSKEKKFYTKKLNLDSANYYPLLKMGNKRLVLSDENYEFSVK